MNLKEFEARLQSLVEVDLLNVLPGRKLDDVIVQKLAAAIHINNITMEDGAILAPNVYTLVMHPETSAKWEDPQLLSILMHSITTVAQEAGFKVYDISHHHHFNR